MSDSESEIGEITLNCSREFEQYYEIDWKIQDFFSYTKEDSEYQSPEFSAGGLKWYFRIYPNGDFGQDVGWVVLDLDVVGDADEEFTPKIANCSLGVRKVDGKIELLHEGRSREFNESMSIGYGEFKLLERSKLSERRSELAPSGVLVITCNLRVNDELVCASRLLNLSSNLKKLFISKIGSDATLKVQGEEFPVHRFILASRSSVFETMFGTEMKEKVVEIVDCHPASFRDFLVYTYSAEFENSANDILELYRIAHKYCVEDLEDICVLYITRAISLDNVIDVAILGHQYDALELKYASQDFFDENVARVFCSDKWKSLLRSNPTIVEEMLIQMSKKVNIIKK